MSPASCCCPGLGCIFMLLNVIQMWGSCCCRDSRETNKALHLFHSPGLYAKVPIYFWSKLSFVVALQSFVVWLCQGPCSLISEKCQITSGSWKSMHGNDAWESGILGCFMHACLCVAGILMHFNNQIWFICKNILCIHWFGTVHEWTVLCYNKDPTKPERNFHFEWKVMTFGKDTDFVPFG